MVRHLCNSDNHNNFFEFVYLISLILTPILKRLNLTLMNILLTVFLRIPYVKNTLTPISKERNKRELKKKSGIQKYHVPDNSKILHANTTREEDLST